MAAYAALAFLSLLWGSSFLLIKLAARAFEPYPFALLRVGIAAATLVVASLLTRQAWPGWRPALWAKLTALALIGQVAPFFLLGLAATMTTSADMALMMGASPIFVFIAGRVAGAGERWTLAAGLGLALGFAGVGFALWAPGAHGAEAPHAALGRATALAATFCYAMSALISASSTREIGAVRAAAASMSLSTLALAALIPVFGAGRLTATLAAAPAASLLAMLALGVVNTALAYYVYFRLVGEAGPTFASLNNYIVPLLGVVGGATALGEPIAVSAWAGLALVLFGVALTGRSVRLAPQADGVTSAASRVTSFSPSTAHCASSIRSNGSRVGGSG